jgi:hypothetical protein
MMTTRDRNRLLWAAIGFAVVLAIALYWAGPSWAQDVVATPGGAAVVPEGADIVIPWGAWLSELSSLLATLIFGAMVWLLRRLPSNVVAILQTMRAEQLLQKAIDYGVNAVAGATKDRVLTVPVANDVVRKAAEYAIASGAPKVIEWMGGADGIMSKIIARLDIEPDSEVPGPVVTDESSPLLRAPKQSSVISTSDVRPSGEF